MKTENNYTEGVHDNSLWQSLKTGCSMSFGNIARLYYVNLLRYGMSLGFERDTVKDAIQNTFVYIWEHHETIGEVQNGKAYLFFALRNRLLRDNKKTKQEQTFFNRLTNIKDVQGSIDMDWIENENDIEMHKSIQQTITKMPPREREVIQLRFYEGLDNEAIADIMGISKQGVANLMVRTLKTFRMVWKEVTALFLPIFIGY